MRGGTIFWSPRTLATAMVLALLPSVSAARGATAVVDLQAAYQQEMNDQARYLAYARQADVEGLGEVGSLFRAVARAEGIHAQICAKLIRRRGDGVASAILEPVRVGTTEENLAAAIENENQQRHRAYPALVHRAKQTGMPQAAEIIHKLQNAEGQHEVLFSQVQSTLRTAKHGEGRFFYVCPECGYVTEEITFDQCPVCFGEEERFEMVE